MKPNKIIYLILFLLCLGLNIYLRLLPAYLPRLKQQARSNVERELAQEVSGIVEQNFSAFNPLIKGKILDNLLDEKRKDKDLIRKKVLEEYKRLKDRYQDESGRTYLLEVDPYSWMRSTRLVLKNGYPGDKRVDGKIYDTHMLAPQGALVTKFRFLFYASSFLYKIFYSICPGLTLEKFLFYLPVFFSGIFLIILYLFCRYFFSEVAGIFAVFFSGLSPVFIGRSSAGWFDNDILSLILPLLVVWCLAAAVKNKACTKNILYSLLASFFLSIYASTWVGWWFIYLVIFGFFLYFISNNLFLHFRDWAKFRKALLPYILSLSVFLAGSIIFCLLIVKTDPLSYTYQYLRQHLDLGKSLSATVWPSTYYTVEELRAGNFISIPPKLGSWPLFVFATASLLWVYLKERRSEKSNVIILLMFWSFFMVIASFRGLRFTLFLSLPFGVFLGLGLSGLLGFISLRIKDLKNAKLKPAMFFLAGAVLYLLVSFSVNVGLDVSKGVLPMMNDDWHSFLIKLKKSTPEDSIINSWWDYGSWFKEVSRRGVIFDGQSQNRPIAYWMARVLLSHNEEEALRILRLLNNSSDKLIHDLGRYLGDELKLVSLLQELIKADAEAADTVLKDYGVSGGIKDRIKEAMFLKRPGPAYFVVDKSMVFKMHEISFLGNWNFASVYIMNNKDMPKEEMLDNLDKKFSLPDKEAERLYNEVMLSVSGRESSEVLSRRLRFYFGLGEGREEDGVIYFSNTVVFDLSSLNARIFFPEQGRFARFKYIFFFNGDDLVYKEFEDADSEIALDEGPVSNISPASGANSAPTQAAEERWRCIGLSKELGKTLFSRLCFMKAKGLKYFEPFILDEDTGLFAFKIKWKN